jgi:hypothetical protein
MKEDKLANFIRNNREEFDDKEPSEKIWTRIERALTFKNESWWNSVMVWRAAAVVFMALSVYLLIPKNPAKNEMAALREFTDVESFYIKQISEKEELIDEFQPRGLEEGLNGFTQDFQQLEAMYFVLKEEMKNDPSQKVKDALVLNLLVRIDLLNQQLHKLEKQSQPDGKREAKANV